MTLLRAAARTLLASYFIASGIKAVRNPGVLVPAAEPVADKLVPLAKQYAPEQVAAFIPEDTETLVRINGATQILGGLALASGRGRRVGAMLLAASLIPSTAAKHPFWTRDDPEERALDKSHFLKNVSLLGGVLLAAGDTEGKPSLAWRAQKGGHAIAQSTSKTKHKVAKKAGELTSGGGNDLAEAALASGAALVSTVVATSRRAAKRARKEAVKAQIVAAKQAKAARKVAEAQAARTAALAAAAAKQAKKDAPKQLKAAREAARAQAEKVGKHIERGRN
jgi:uncharacterized membrane protein YphA (DoxX/SURF4 family)